MRNRSKIAPLTLPKITYCGNLNTVARDSGKQMTVRPSTEYPDHTKNLLIRSPGSRR